MVDKFMPIFEFVYCRFDQFLYTVSVAAKTNLFASFDDRLFNIKKRKNRLFSTVFIC